MEYQKKHDGVLILSPEGSEQSVDTTLAKNRQTVCTTQAGDWKQGCHNLKLFSFS